MKKPKYTEQLYSFIFLCLACSFIISGLFSLIDILKPSPHSMIQDSKVLGMSFLVIGIAFFMIQAIFKILASTKNKLHLQLINNGVKISGTVEKVYKQRYTQYGKQSPYRILYTYTYQGKIYHHKSHLLWKKPNVKEKDLIEIYIDDSGKSVIPLPSEEL